MKLVQLVPLGDMRLIKVNVNIGKGWELKLEKLDFDGDSKPTDADRKKLEAEIKETLPFLQPIEINFMDD